MSEAESKRIFQKKFNALLADRQITQKEVAVICGVSTSTVSTWSKGLNMPRMDKIETLASYFGILKSDLIEDKSIPTPQTAEAVPLPTNEARLLSLYRDLNSEGQEKLVDYADDLVTSGKYIKNNPLHMAAKQA